MANSYIYGYRWCGRCGGFMQSWVDKGKLRKGLCEECHSRLRARAKGSPARRARELAGLIKRI